MGNEQWIVYREYDEAKERFMHTVNLWQRYLQTFAPLETVAKDIKEVRKHEVYKKAKTDVARYEHARDNEKQFTRISERYPDCAVVEVFLNGAKVDAEWATFMKNTTGTAPRDITGFQSELTTKVGKELAITEGDYGFVHFETNPRVSDGNGYTTLIVFTNPKDAAKARMIGVLTDLR